jgi:hypothetical protein
MTRSSWNRRSDEEAKRIISEAGFTPLENYPGAAIPWQSVHIKCGTTCSPRLSKVIKGIGQCPKCNLESRKGVAKKRESFAEAFPEMAREAFGWDPSTVSYSSGKTLEFKCSLGHLWNARIADRAKDKTKCPVCSGKKVWFGFNDLYSLSPEVSMDADGWDPKLKLDGSKEEVSWKCALGHKWKSSIYNRTRLSSGCPYCAEFSEAIDLGVNDLVSTHPKIALEADGWDASQFRAGSSRKMNWICNAGHKYQATITHRTSSKSACPYCAGLKILPGFNDLQIRFPQIALEADGWDPTQVASGSHKTKQWKCSKKHVWKASPASRIYANSGCPSCATYGFDPNAEGYLYFLEHMDWGMLQIGITNYPKDRLRIHEKLGWTLLELRGPMDGQLARDWEKAILSFLHSEGASMNNQSPSGKFTGYTESWMKSTFPVDSLFSLMNLVDESERFD